MTDKYPHILRAERLEPNFYLCLSKVLAIERRCYTSNHVTQIYMIHHNPSQDTMCYQFVIFNHSSFILMSFVIFSRVHVVMYDGRKKWSLK